MATSRIDIHRPSAIVPDDYTFVGFEHTREANQGDLGALLALQAERQIIRAHMARTGGTYSHHEHGGNCHVCGAWAIYTVLYYHQPSNSYIRTGFDCAQKLDMGGDWERGNRFRAAIQDAREAQAGKRKAQALLGDEGLSTAWDIYIADWETLPAQRILADGTRYIYQEENTIRDIVGKLVKYGSISPKQYAFIRSLLDRIARRSQILAERAAERAIAAPCPKGRVTVKGTVIKTDERETDFGLVTKMLIKAQEGYMVWCTVPRAWETPERNASIEVTVTLEPSKDDPKFGFGSRPTGRGPVKAEATQAQ